MLWEGYDQHTDLPGYGMALGSWTATVSRTGSVSEASIERNTEHMLHDDKLS